MPAPKGRGAGWGGLARRAAGRGGTAAPQEPPRGRLAGSGPSKAAEAFQAASRRDDDRGEIIETRIEEVDQDGMRSAARRAVRQATATPEAQPQRRRRTPPAALTEELGREVGASTAPKLATRLADAGRAFEAERFQDAKRILTALARQAPGSAAVRELHGLTLYRLGKWAPAAKELEAFRTMSGSTDQHPVLADCYRALRRYDEVESLWAELREASPSAELVAEGRIVHAGALADRGDIRGAIGEIEPALRRVKRPRTHHLRLLYVLADLYERAGDVPHARHLFDRILAADPDFGDTARRRRGL